MATPLSGTTARAASRWTVAVWPTYASCAASSGMAPPAAARLYAWFASSLVHPGGRLGRGSSNLGHVIPIRRTVATRAKHRRYARPCCCHRRQAGVPPHAERRRNARRSGGTVPPASAPRTPRLLDNGVGSDLIYSTAESRTSSTRVSRRVAAHSILDRRDGQIAVTEDLEDRRRPRSSQVQEQDDDYLVALAISASAALLVSGNDDLLALTADRPRVRRQAPALR